MDFELSETQRQVRDMTHQFAKDEVRPHAAALDREARFPRDLVRRMSELGLMGMMVPEASGGAGLDAVSYAIAMENVSWGCASTGVIMSVSNSLYCDPVLKNARPALHDTWLAPFARGERLGCFGLTEPMSGSDAQNMATRAEKRGDRYVLRGQKNFITNGPEADAIVVFASHGAGIDAQGTSAFIVPRDTKGYLVEASDKKLGIRGAHSCSIAFDDCEIPEEMRLSTEGGGFKIAMHTLDGGRIGIAAQALGIARAAYEAARDWALERKAFGKTISEHQAIQFKLADMATEIDAARLLTWRAAFLKDKGLRHSRESAMAKLYASETAMRVTKEAIQVFGGYGYITEYPVERHFRDAKICEIYEGTSEIQRIVIAAQVFKQGVTGALGY
ncbi:MAG: acyl-CoA dehydrogenase family protein [Deltaproteobacteria bacterium]|nr:acyl-CoA dehydrogenase family protein [Deltaproteobacteria bacterium]